MSRKGYKIRFALILLAGLVILLHSTIPHRHHLDSYSNNTCTTQKRGESPIETKKHCHALNNIVLKKVTSINVDSKTATNALFFSIAALNLVKFNNRVLFTTLPIKDIVILKQHLTAELSFRGPPALS